MKTITFECEIVTPMFLAGADGRTPELRPASIKGALRFWWRAMHGDLGIDELRMQEAELFGGGGENARRSLLSIKLGKNKTKTQANASIGIQNGTGIGYLLYSSLFMNKRDCIQPDVKQTFELSLVAKNTKVLEESLKAFACLLFFGGFGSRTRRGAGSIFIKKIEGNAVLSVKDILKVFETKDVETKEQLQKHIEVYLKPFIQSKPADGRYSALNGASLYLLNPEDNWKKSLEIIGGKFKSERSNIQSEIGKTPNFGFPIQHKNTGFMMLGGTVSYNDHDRKAIKNSDRRASPLIISVIKTENNFYFPLVLHFQGELLPNGQKIIDKKAGEWTDSTVKAVINKREESPDPMYVQEKFLDKLRWAIHFTL